MHRYVITCQEIEEGDQDLVGMKSFGVAALLRRGIPVPKGFTLTTEAFCSFIRHNAIQKAIGGLNAVDGTDVGQIERCANDIQRRIRKGQFPNDVADHIWGALADLAGKAVKDWRWAVRSSCNHEDLTGASFAGLYSSFINVSHDSLLRNIIDCYASLYSSRVLSYAAAQGISADKLQMGVLIQELIDAQAAGTLFTADVTSGFAGVHQIEGVWGFGEGVVSGRTIPNAWTVFKRSGKAIRRTLGQVDSIALASGQVGLNVVETPADKRDAFCLRDDDVRTLARYASDLEEWEGHPLDLEWVKSMDGRLVLLQMRPLALPRRHLVRYTIDGANQDQRPLVRGIPITDKAVWGTVRLASGSLPTLTKDDILVAKYVDLNWLPYLKTVRGIVVESGGYTSHSSIILREHAIPSLFGAEGACELLADGDVVTLVCSGDQGSVWASALPLREERIDGAAVNATRHKVCVVTSTLSNIDQVLTLPLDGIGLVRLEFVVYGDIGIHPMALIDYDSGSLPPGELRRTIAARTRGYASARDYYVSKLSEGICGFASRCPDKIVNVRVPDFIGADYLTLLGSEAYEPVADTNPMLGLRGTSRLIDDRYRSVFAMDCEAFRRVIDDHGFNNVRILVPFCRTPEDGATIKRMLIEHGVAGISIGMMVEVPSNVMLARRFAEIFDFFLIGPMDLTQLTYGADRSSSSGTKYCNETEAVKEMVKHFLSEIQDQSRDVFIGGWPLFQYLAEYERVKGTNRLHLVELPDRLLDLFANLHALEKRLEVIDGR